MKSVLSIFLIAAASILPPGFAFTINSHTTTVRVPKKFEVTTSNLGSSSEKQSVAYTTPTPTQLFSSNDDGETAISLGESEQTILGVSGFIASLIMLYSESTLFQTGCGLPAGPFGLVGAAEGVSYLGVVGLVGYSLFTKITTGSGLPAGPKGILGAAEGVAYLAILAGILVLVAQVTNYGYIPNAVPMEGGMCR
mmetsp:Transcript_22613/g.45788  ORF Transcript_22613/g.45788 Transcript_22613/m.45788 type:complete len:195 (+) Transcript_22613:84-668(+)